MPDHSSVAVSFRPRARANDLLFTRRRPRNARGEEEEEALHGLDEEEGEEDEREEGEDNEEQGGRHSFDRFDEEAFLREVEPNGIPLEEIAPAEDPLEEPEDLA